VRVGCAARGRAAPTTRAIDVNNTSTDLASKRLPGGEDSQKIEHYASGVKTAKSPNRGSSFM
jgi:hypothetical protein